MPVQGPQQPGFYLPGAEFFALSPNTHIALQGRRRLNFNPLGSGVVLTVPANSIQNTFGQLRIETNFTATAGIFVHYATLIWSPQDFNGELQVGQASIGFNMSSATPGNFVGFNLGIPTATNVSPIGTQNILLERDVLLNGFDILTSSGASPGNLFVQAAVTAKNVDATNAHSVAIFVQLIYTRLDGIIE